MSLRPAALRALTIIVSITVAGCALLSPSPSPSTTPVPTSVPSPTPRPTPIFTATPAPSPTPVLLHSDTFNRRLTVLFIGTDSTPARVNNGYGPLTDSMIVVSIDPTHTHLSMVALPRDTVDIPLGNGSTWRLKANAIYNSYGADGLERALEATYGVPIDYWVKIDMPDFPRLVDALGGVWVDVPYAIHDSQAGLNIGAGAQRINGATALAYARARHQDSDYARQGRQMELLAAVAHRISLLDERLSIDTLLTLLTTMKTNAPLDDLPTMFKVVAYGADADLTATVLTPPRFALFTGIEPGGGRGWVMIANVPAMRSYVRSLMGN